VSRVRRDRDDGGGLDVTPFILVERGIDTRGRSSVMLSAVEVDDDFLRNVAAHYFGEWRWCRLVTDVAGSGESPVDDVSDAQRGGTAIEETAFVRLLQVLTESGVGFVIWHGSDYSNLPVVHSWSDVLESLRSQTRSQPADVYLRFVPPDATSA
jgi:hypothetical protein